MSEENEDADGYALAEDYAMARAAFMTVEEITEQLKNGTIKGRVINNSWYVKSSLKIKRPEDIAAETRANIEVSAKADKDFMKSLKPVKVVSVDIPFGDVLVLTFKSAVAALIVFGIPVLILALNSG